MSWKINNIPIVVTKVNDSAVQAIARLQPLASGTLYHHFGYEFLVKKVTGYIVGTVDKGLIIDLTRTGDPYTLLNWAGFTLGDYYVKSANFDMQNSANQTFLIDANHDCTDQVFVVDLELFKNE